MSETEKHSSVNTIKIRKKTATVYTKGGSVAKGAGMKEANDRSC